MTETTEKNEIRKAAVFVRSLDTEAAAAIVARLSPAEAKALRVAIRELGEVTDDERQGLLAELQTTAASTPLDSQGDGVELQLDSAPIDPLATASNLNQMPSETPTTSSPFQGLCNVDTDTLVRYLRHEQPLTVAVVLSYLPAGQAAATLAGLPSEIQTTALDRLADLGDADPESLKVLATELETWIAEHQQEQRRQASRLTTIQGILAAAAPEARERLVGTAGGRKWAKSFVAEIAAPPSPTASPSPAELPTTPVNDAPVATTEAEVEQPEEHTAPVSELSAPLPLLIRFDELESLDTGALTQIMRRATAEQLLLALAGGSERLVRRVEKMLPRRQAKAFRKRLTSLGPTRLRDVEIAQRQLAEVASKLIHTGHIVIRRATAA